MAASQETAAQTLLLLEERLRRVDYALYGRKNDEDEDEDEQEAKARHTGSAAARLRNLERALQSLAAKSSTVTDILTLQNRHSDLFRPTISSSVPSALQPASLASLILAHSQLYHSLSTCLSQLQDTSIPDPSAIANLVELRPRIEKAQVKQRAQAQELADLRARSAKMVETWYEDGVLGMGDRWAEWEERLRDAEILVRRKEAARKREEGLV